MSDYHYALDLGGQATLIKPRLAMTHYAIGSQCFNEQDYEGANIEFTRAIDFFGGSADFYVNRARSSMQLGLIEQAFKDLQKTLELDPTHAVAASMMQNFNRSSKLAFTGRNFVKI